MFSGSVIWYLFFAGAGSGLAFVAFVVDSGLRRFWPRLFAQYRPLMALALCMGLALTLVGAVFLLFDLGRPERILRFVTDSRFSVLTVGAWAVLGFVVLTGAQLMARVRWAHICPQAVHIVLRWATAAAAVLVMTYTGLLLQSLYSLHFFATPLLPLLFVLSSLSCGVALLLLLAFFRQPDGISLWPYARLASAHLPLLVLEIVVLGGYLVLMANGTPTAAASAARLISGDYALIFWGGVVVAGLLLPLVLEFALRGRASWNSMAIYATACMVGALALRFCFLSVGAHPSIQFELGI
jgi:formate-dependent nitrite reductase membrane component NrfD